jgi:sterol desaturase/sphingolipid hydroxylase (fatty acid hydroxylase superfamily)
MGTVSLNYLAIVVAAVAAFGIGGWWYSLKGFGKDWMKLMGINPKDKRKMNKMKKEGRKSMVIGFLTTLLTAYILAHFVDLFNATSLIEGMIAGFWIWAGFVATVMLGSVLWESKPFKLYFLNAGYELVKLIIMGAILAVWV